MSLHLDSPAPHHQLLHLPRHVEHQVDRVILPQLTPPVQHGPCVCGCVGGWAPGTFSYWFLVSITLVSSQKHPQGGLDYKIIVLGKVVLPDIARLCASFLSMMSFFATSCYMHKLFDYYNKMNVTDNANYNNKTNQNHVISIYLKNTIKSTSNKNM